MHGRRMDGWVEKTNHSIEQFFLTWYLKRKNNNNKLALVPILPAKTVLMMD